MEPAVLYDSVLICREFYGNESRVNGWFPSFRAFAAQDEHIFFKGRNRAACGLAYNNLDSRDKMDFAFWCSSIGVRVWGPITNQEGAAEAPLTEVNEFMSHLFQYDLPNHASIQFQTEQDEKLSQFVYGVPPGYGSVMAGCTMGIDTYSYVPEAAPDDVMYPSQIFVGTQGTPDKKNRFQFANFIGIPRTGTIQCRLKISEFLKQVLADADGPGDLAFLYPADEPYAKYWPARYGVTVSLYGMREVQQRGQYHV